MARYIDADLLKEQMYHEAFEKTTDMQRWDSGCWIRYHMFEDTIESIPTADVVERKKGRWIAVKIGNGDTRYTCSECGASYECDSRDTWDFNYCPNCGA